MVASPFSQPAPGRGQMWRGLRIGLLGGSFNPAHAGHRAISLHALKALRLDQVWWLVSPQNPLKSRQGMAALPERLTGARQTAAHPRIVATALESQLGTRYTAQTLRALILAFPRTRFVWLMGADNLAQIRHWKNWPQIFLRTPIAVFNRSPYCRQGLQGLAALRFRRFRIPVRAAAGLARRTPPGWVFFPAPLHPASATALRAARGQTALQPPAHPA